MISNEIKELFGGEWYIQSFNATPFLILPAGALSGLKIMPKSLGFGYTVFPVFFSDDYCSAYYRVSDLNAIYAHFKRKPKKTHTTLVLYENFTRISLVAHRIFSEIWKNKSWIRRNSPNYSI